MRSVAIGGKEIRIYFEGDDQLRSGFRQFFGPEFQRCRLVALNGDPVGKYKIALKSNLDACNILLLDSEQALDGSTHRERQLVSFADRVFWMIELMESWFLADRQALKSYYEDGRGLYQESSLPGDPNRVESIPKRDVLEGLKNATRRTKKGIYHKTGHAPAILGIIDSERVAHSAPQCRRLFNALAELIANNERPIR